MSKVRMMLIAVMAMTLSAGVSFGVDVLERAEGAKKLSVNVKCPMSGRDIDAEQTSTYQGEVVAFCCGNCKGNFDEDPSGNISKVERLTVNVECPVSGRAVDAAQTVTYEGRTVGFCCENCKGKFEEEPTAIIDDVKYEPVNKKCPMSGRDINPEQISVYQSRVVAFCCGDCKGGFDDDPAGKISEVEIDNRE